MRPPHIETSRPGSQLTRSSTQVKAASVWFGRHSEQSLIHPDKSIEDGSIFPGTLSICACVRSEGNSEMRVGKFDAVQKVSLQP